jgi:hypothetical protein
MISEEMEVVPMEKDRKERKEMEEVFKRIRIYGT